jgi:hypothetical protein
MEVANEAFAHELGEYLMVGGALVFMLMCHFGITPNRFMKKDRK